MRAGLKGSSPISFRLVIRTLLASHRRLDTGNTQPFAVVTLLKGLISIIVHGSLFTEYLQSQFFSNVHIRQNLRQCFYL
jgi:hypothetical protein